MVVSLPRFDERFREEVRRSRRLFFLSLSASIVAIAAEWARSAGFFSGEEITGAAENNISFVYGHFGGGAR